MIPLILSENSPISNPRSKNTLMSAREKLKVTVSTDRLSEIKNKNKTKLDSEQTKMLKTLKGDKNHQIKNKVMFTNISITRHARSNQVLDGTDEKPEGGIIDLSSQGPPPSTRRRENYRDKERSPVIGGDGDQMSRS